MREILTSKGFPAPRFRYSPCVRTGPFYQLAGMVALDSETGALVPGGPEAETRQILGNLVRGLPELGLGLEHLVAATIYTTRFDEFPAINRVWEEVFRDEVEPPARTSVGVSALPLGASVEIEFRLYKAEGT